MTRRLDLATRFRAWRMGRRVRAGARCTTCRDALTRIDQLRDLLQEDRT